MENPPTSSNMIKNNNPLVVKVSWVYQWKRREIYETEMLKESFPLPNSETKQNPLEESEHFFEKGNEQEKGLTKTYFNCF